MARQRAASVHGLLVLQDIPKSKTRKHSCGAWGSGRSACMSCSEAVWEAKMVQGLRVPRIRPQRRKPLQCMGAGKRACG